MNKINWINGQAGGTPLSAENLNQMQDNMENAIGEVDEKYSRHIITAYATQTSTVAQVNKGLELNQLAKVGNKLSVVNNKVVIGTGVSKIKVSAKLLIDEQQLTTSFIYIGLNGNVANRGDGYGVYNTITLTDKLLNVNQGDIITMSVTSGTNANISEDSYITVEVIE